MTEARESYYLMLGLDLHPPEHDKHRIAAQINACQTNWTEQLSNADPKIKAHVATCLNAIPDMKKVLQDPEGRSQEIALALQQLAQKKQVQINALKQDLQFAQAKGYLARAEFELLCTRFKNHLSATDIAQCITVPIREPEPAAASNTGLSDIEKRNFKATAKNLSSIGVKNLYDFLALSSDAETKDLRSKSTKEQTRLRKTKSKDPKHGIRQNLIGQCLAVFKDDAERKKYDLHLDESRFHALDAKIELVGADGLIETTEWVLLLEHATAELDLELQKAQDYIIHYARQKQWTLQMPGQLPDDFSQRCSACHAYNSSKASQCKKCGFALQLACPACQHLNSSGNQCCTECSFALSHIPGVHKAIQAARKYLQQHDLDAAETELSWAEQHWAAHPDLKALQKKLQQLQQQLQPLLQDIAKAQQQRQLFRLQTLLIQLAKQSPGHALLQTEAVLKQDLNTVAQLLTSARGAQSPADKIAAFEQALQIASDCDEAHQGLLRLPPEAPAHLQASLEGQSVKVQWQPVSRGSTSPLRYRLLRKYGAPPQNPQDGTLLAETSQTEYRDTQLESGQLAWYGVFSERQGVLSARGALSQAVCLLQEVMLKQVLPGNGEVRLLWELPAGASGVSVCRKSGAAPDNMQDGELLTGASTSGFRDTGLQNQQRYAYRLAAVYVLEGQQQLSAGQIVYATPVLPPAPVSQVQAERQGADWFFQWNAPASGGVRLFWSLTEAPFQYGEHLSTAQLTQLGNEIPVQHPTQTRWQAGPDQPVLYYLHAVSVEKELAVMGCSQQLSGLEDVGRLRLEHHQQKLFLEWEWPLNSERILICWRSDMPPTGPEDLRAQQAICKRESYAHNQAWVFSDLSAEQYYFTVFNFYEEQGKRYYARGQTIHFSKRPLTRLRYHLRQGTGLLGLIRPGLTLELQADHETRLPEIKVVGKKSGLPTHLSDGQVLATIPANQSLRANKPLRLPLELNTQGSDSGKLYLRLFIANEAEAPYFQIMMPKSEALRLNR